VPQCAPSDRINENVYKNTSEANTGVSDRRPVNCESSIEPPHVMAQGGRRAYFRARAMWVPSAFDWEVMQRLHQKGFITGPVGRCSSAAC
jgi:hypothetical protein